MGTNTKSVSETVSTKFSAVQFFDCLSTWFFGIVMLVAAIPHLDNPYYFLGSVYSYKLVEPGIGQAVVMILPLLQLVLAVCLILRVQVDAASFASMTLFGIFFCVQLFAYLGGLDISCGCFGPQHSSQIGVASLSFVGILFLLSLSRVLFVFFVRNDKTK
jgi:hypothetical protein